MSVDSYKNLRSHVGHPVHCVCYGDEDNPANVAIECIECGCVLVDYDQPDDYREVTITLTMTQKEWTELANCPGGKAEMIERGEYDGILPPEDEAADNPRWVATLRSVEKKVQDACMAHEVPV